MKRIITGIVVILCFIFYSGCSSSNSVEINIDMQALQSKIESAGLFSDTLERITKESVLSSVLFLTPGNIETSMLYMGSGYTGEEYALFICVSEEAAKQLTEELMTRVDTQKAIYADYAPDAIPRLNNALIKQQGKYVVYVVADKHAQALKIVEENFK